MELYDELQKKTRQLDASIKRLRTSGTEYADAEQKYKILLRFESLKLRDEGMAVGMIDKVVYGIQEVSDARKKRDIAETVYRANLEAINSLKLQLRLIDAQIQREWGAV